MKTVIINLTTSLERKEKMAARLAALGIPHDFFAAIDGRTVPHPLFKRYHESRCLRNRRAPLSGGELGCWASHFLLWQRCVDLGEPLVVLEDDLDLLDTFPAALAVLEGKMDALGYVRLAGIFPAHTRKLGNLGSWSLQEYTTGPGGTQAYALHPRAAAQFLVAAADWWLAVDDFMDRYWRNGVTCYGLLPHPVAIPTCDSDIPRLPKFKRSPWGSLRREATRFAERLRRRWYRMSHQTGQRFPFLD